MTIPARCRGAASFASASGHSPAALAAGDRSRGVEGVASAAMPIDHAPCRAAPRATLVRLPRAGAAYGRRAHDHPGRWLRLSSLDPPATSCEPESGACPPLWTIALGALRLQSQRVLRSAAPKPRLRMDQRLYAGHLSDAPRPRRATQGASLAFLGSGRQDLNLRPPGPQPERSGCLGAGSRGVERLRVGHSCPQLRSLCTPDCTPSEQVSTAHLRSTRSRSS